jgi:hypothetical protein
LDGLLLDGSTNSEEDDEGCGGGAAELDEECGGATELDEGCGGGVVELDEGCGGGGGRVLELDELKLLGYGGALLELDVGLVCDGCDELLGKGVGPELD